MKNYINLFVSLFFIGYIKKAPGTFASAFSIIILYFITSNKFFSINLLLIIFFFILLLSIYLINLFQKQTKTHDSKIIVIDEFIGIFLIYLFYDKLFIVNDFISCLLIFVLFRFFDILKVFPANIIDKKMINSFGVILDDIIAAIYTIIILYLINKYAF